MFLFNKIRSAISRLKRRREQVYVSRISRRAPWAYVSYIADVFYHRDDKEYLNSHQNKREALAIVDILNGLGYNVYVQNCSSSRSLPILKNVDLVFGLEPLFGRACSKYTPKTRLYYATGAYWRHQNNQIVKHTDMFNERYSCNIPYRRLVAEHYSCEIADCIVQIGGKNTIETYPEEIRNKVFPIHQSSIEYEFPVNTSFSSGNEFLYMASSGNVLKGLDLVIEFFSTHPELIVNIVGPIEEDVMRVINSIITPNIKVYGWLSIDSMVFRKIVDKCNFFIYPSGSEGCPGSVINVMRMGLIPIVSRWAAFDEIEDYGYMMDEWSVQAIDSAIEWSKLLSHDTVCEMKHRAVAFINDTYNINRFSSEFKNTVSRYC